MSAATPLSIPEGSLVRSRAVADVGETLAAALDRELTGYAVLEPGGTVLLDADRRGVLTFADGVPVLAYCEPAGDDPPERGPGGTDALAALSGPGPWAVDLYELPAGALESVHGTDGGAADLRVPPGMPAEDLAADPALADRTRERAPAERTDAEPSAVEAFLADEERIAEIREQARTEAKDRAAEWGLADQLADDGPGGEEGTGGLDGVDGAGGVDGTNGDGAGGVDGTNGDGAGGVDGTNGDGAGGTGGADG